MDFEQIIAQLVAKALKDLSNLERPIEELSKLVEAPKDSKLGDLAFPCFTFAKELKKAPPVIAKELAIGIAKIGFDAGVFTKCEATGPYLNFFKNKASVARDLIPAILDGHYLARRQTTGERVMIEYSQPNTHKAFHVGHIRCAALGDSVGRILEWSGHDVVPVNYLGDEGTHVARCLWYLTTQFKGTPPETNRGEFLGVLYNKAYLMVDLPSLSRAPVPGVIVGSVTKISLHPAEPKWKVVTVKIPAGDKVIVTAGTGFAQGDLVPYAPVGVEVNDKALGIVERKGVKSEGMVLSEKELGLSDDNYKIPVLPKESELGSPVIDLFPIPDLLPAGAKVSETIQRRNKEISELLQRLEAGDPKTVALWKETKQWSMEEFYRVYSWLNCRFDHYFFESEFGEEGKKLAREYLKRGVFVESDGAIGADLKAFGLGFCLLIKRDGTALYATRDLALAQKKFEQYKIDRSLYVVDMAQTLHFQQVFKCLELMGYKQVAKCRHIPYGQVVRPEGKMSSRKGNVILFSQLQERLSSKITSEFLEKNRGEWPDDEIKIAEHYIALGTMRYGMLNQDLNSNIIFDLDAWTSRSGNTGPYMMYAYTRTRSILREMKGYDRSKCDWNVLIHETEEELLNHLAAYHEAVRFSAENTNPLHICVYVYELAKRFSRMYQFCSVMNAENEPLKATRAALVEATGLVIQHALGLLGIKTVERM